MLESFRGKQSYEFQNQIKTVGTDQFNSVIKKSESTIASTVEAHCLLDDFSNSETYTVSFTPQIGEQVLGDKLATVVEAPGDDETMLVQYGKIRVCVKKNSNRAIPSSKSNNAANSASRLKKQEHQSEEFHSPSTVNNAEEASYGPWVQTSKNTVDLRGMQVEEAAQLDVAISCRESHSVLFVIHGTGKGVVRERALDILSSHSRVASAPEGQMRLLGIMLVPMPVCLP